MSCYEELAQIVRTPTNGPRAMERAGRERGPREPPPQEALERPRRAEAEARLSRLTFKGIFIEDVDSVGRP